VTDGKVLWLCGPTGVGKSTVGFHLYQNVLRSGVTAAFVDARQLGFLGPTPAGPTVVAHNLAAVWQTFREAGATAMIVVGPLEEGDLAVYSAVLPAITVYRLHAEPATLTERIMLRGRGHGWAEPGDPLTGKPIEHLERIAHQAAAAQSHVGTRIDTDGRMPDEIAAAIPWPS
jgi:hypothetical protein